MINDGGDFWRLQFWDCCLNNEKHRLFYLYFLAFEEICPFPSCIHFDHIYEIIAKAFLFLIHFALKCTKWSYNIFHQFLEYSLATISVIFCTVMVVVANPCLIYFCWHGPHPSSARPCQHTHVTCHLSHQPVMLFQSLPLLFGSNIYLKEQPVDKFVHKMQEILLIAIVPVMFTTIFDPSSYIQAVDKITIYQWRSLSGMVAQSTFCWLC